jgi:dinuclear metal center YbgI/SA1388 family protein
VINALRDLVAYLDDLLNVAQYMEEQPSNGLMVDGGRDVTRIAAAVSTSFTSIAGARDSGAELLLVHHTTWENVDRGLKPRKEAMLREAGISLYGAHAALDCAPEFGNNDVLARLLGVRIEGRFLEWAGGRPGVYGEVDGTFDELLERLRAVNGTPVEAWRNNGSFGRIAIVTGAASWTAILEEAQALGCDTYITGEGTMDTKRFAREIGVNLVFGTHYGTEQHGVTELAARLSSHFGLPWTFVPEDPDIL